MFYACATATGAARVCADTIRPGRYDIGIGIANGEPIGASGCGRCTSWCVGYAARRATATAGRPGSVSAALRRPGTTAATILTT